MKLGSKHSAEARAKIGAASKGNTHMLGKERTLETRAKIRAGLLGRRHSAEALIRMSEVQSRPETRARASARWKGENNPRWSPTPSYAAAHFRLHKQRGKASAQRCVECGGLAHTWALIHGLGELQDERGRPYSANLDAYQPMCYCCHRAYDRS